MLLYSYCVFDVEKFKVIVFIKENLCYDNL